MNISPLYELPKSGILIPTSDWHIGAEEHDEPHFDDMLRFAKEERAGMVLGGDHIENAVAAGKAPGEKLLGQSKWPTEQFKIFIDKMLPFAKRGQIIGIIRGNHDARTRREALVDLCEIAAHSLGVPYFGVGVIARVKHGSQVYTTAWQHGRAGARNYFMELDRMMHRYPTAEVVGLGHIHVLDARRVAHLEVDPEGRESVGMKHQVRTGCFLKLAEYAREALYAPPVIGAPVIRFGRKEHAIEVDTKTLSWI